jgi:hypothetical protein
MSSYDEPTNSNIFNPIDYNTPGDSNTNESYNDNTDEHDNFVTKNGSEISSINSKINNNQINILNNKNTIQNNSDKLINVTVNNDETVINLLKTDNIILTNINGIHGNQTFNAADKLLILTNQGNIQNNSNKLINVTVNNNETFINLLKTDNIILTNENGN